MTTDLAQLEFARLAIDETTPADVCADWLDKLQAFMAHAKDAERLLKERLVWWIKTTGQDIVIGSRRYYVGTPKVTKCVDHTGTLEELFEVLAGDMEAVADCLASGAFKHGECSKVLPPDVYARLFETTRTAVLKEGVAKKQQLLVVDEQFVKPRS